MSSTVEGVDGGRPPMAPWQKALLFFIIFAVLVLFYLAMKGHHPQSKVVDATPPIMNPSGGSVPFERPVDRPVLPPPPAPMPEPAATPMPMMPAAPDTPNPALKSDIFGGGEGGGGVERPVHASGEGADAALASSAGGSRSELAQRLTPTILGGSKATRLPHPDLTILQGTTIPCIDQTAMDSSYSGFIDAILPNDVRGATGRVILMEKGTKLFGSMERAMINGLDRQFVLWQQATTPDFVRITLNSPAADELGRTGLDGDVNRHLWEKIKGVVFISLLQGGIQAATNETEPKNGNSISFNQVGQNSSELTNTLLESTINIPDVLTRNQGAACTIFVARDLDFSGIYSLEPTR